jgi:hypothetical protein
MIRIFCSVNLPKVEGGEMKKLLITLAILLTACQPSPEMVKNAIILTQASYTATPEPTEPPTSTETPAPTETRTIAPTLTATVSTGGLRLRFMEKYPGSTYITDINADVSWKEFGDYHARNLAIAKPYHWDFYNLSEGTTWKDVQKHYKVVAAERGYTLKRDEYNEEIKMGIMSFIKDEAYIYVQCWNSDKPSVQVYYKNVES